MRIFSLNVMLTFDAFFKCISHVSLVTDTRGHVVDDRARGVDATRAGAGVSTRVTGAGSVTGAVSIDQTLWPAASDIGVTLEAGRTATGAEAGVRGHRGQSPGATGVRLTWV